MIRRMGNLYASSGPLPFPRCKIVYINDEVISDGGVTINCPLLQTPISSKWAQIDGEYEIAKIIYAEHLAEPRSIELIRLFVQYIYTTGDLMLHKPYTDYGNIDDIDVLVGFISGITGLPIYNYPVTNIVDVVPNTFVLDTLCMCGAIHLLDYASYIPIDYITPPAVMDKICARYARFPDYIMGIINRQKEIRTTPIQTPFNMVKG